MTQAGEGEESCSLVLGSVLSFSWRNQSKPHICAFFKIVAHLRLVCPNDVFLFIWQKSYDAISGTCMLRLAWVSQACSEQRKGRAGRTHPGICYHMFSRTRYRALQQYHTPEILRMPLQVIGDPLWRLDCWIFLVVGTSLGCDLLNFISCSNSLK